MTFATRQIPAFGHGLGDRIDAEGHALDVMGRDAVSEREAGEPDDVQNTKTR